MAALGSGARQALLDRIVAHYKYDDRIRAIVVFGSVSTGEWHELSDIDLDIVVADDVCVEPRAEVAALFGKSHGVIVARADRADVVLDSLEEISVRWHPLASTSPNIVATARVVHGSLSFEEIVAAGRANIVGADVDEAMDSFVRDAVGARKAICRGMAWEACACVERMRRTLTRLRGSRDGLLLDPSDPALALEAVLAHARESWDFGRRRSELLERLDELLRPA